MVTVAKWGGASIGGDSSTRQQLDPESPKKYLFCSKSQKRFKWPKSDFSHIHEENVMNHVFKGCDGGISVKSGEW